MLLEWEDYSTVRYTEKLTVERCAIPEIAKKSGKVMERTTLSGTTVASFHALTTGLSNL